MPVTGPATLRAGDPPREGVVEFTDERRTVALPIRAALPVLTKAHARDDLHPSVGLLSGAALLGLRLVAAGKLEPADRPELADGARSTPTTRTGCGALAARRPGRPWRRPRTRPGDARRRRRRDAAALPRRRSRRRRTPSSGSFQRTAGPPAGAACPTPPTCRSWSGSRCGSRPTRRSWSPAPSGWCSRSTTSRTRCTCATPRCCGPSPAPARPRVRATGPAPTRRSRCAAAADAWPVLDRLLELRVPDQITLDTDELVSLLEHGVAALADRGVDVLWPRSLGRDLTATAVLDRRVGRTASRGAAARRAVRRRRAVQLQLAGRAARRAAHRGGDGPAGQVRGADPAAARQLDGRRPGDGPQGAQAAGPHGRSPAQALAAALTGTVEVGQGDDAVDEQVVVGATLLKVRERLLGAADPRADRATRRAGRRRCATTSGTG